MYIYNTAMCYDGAMDSGSGVGINQTKTAMYVNIAICNDGRGEWRVGVGAEPLGMCLKLSPRSSACRCRAEQEL